MKFCLIVLLLLAGSISADESQDGNSYLCVPDKATGFAFKDTTKTWDPTNFRVTDDKYIVRPVKSEDKFFGSPIASSYAVWKLGEDNPVNFCEDGISEHDWLHCGGNGNRQFVFNARSNRFMQVFHGSYMTATFDFARDEDGLFKTDENGDYILQDQKDEGGDTPVIEIGKCSKL